MRDEGPMLETLHYTIRIGSTPTFLHFDLYLYSAYAAHYVYYIIQVRFISVNTTTANEVYVKEVFTTLFLTFDISLREMFSSS